MNISRFDLQKVADFLPYPFIIAEVIDGEHFNTFLNEKFLEEIGFTLDEIPTISAWYTKAYPDEVYRNSVIQNWDQEEIKSQQKGTVFVKNKSLVTCKQGTKKWYEIKASVINAVHVVAFVDLDKEIRQQEELKKINQNNDQMLSILGHDLRSPVANLMAISTLAAHADISKSDYATLIQSVNEQSRQVLELLENTLNWARLNFNSITITPVAIDFNCLVSNILCLHQESYKSKNITVTVAIENAGEQIVDMEILMIIVRNLLSNAIKFTPPNGTIAIKVVGNELSITDNGIGMTQSMIQSIWSHTYSSRAGTNNEQGTGLGLQLVISLAEKINARLVIESEEQKGTTMHLIFDAI